MSRLLSQALVLGALCITTRLPILKAQSAGRKQQLDQATIALTVAGQPLTLANVHVAKMPKDLPAPAVAPTPAVAGAAAAPAAPAVKPGEIGLELPSTPDSVTSRLADNQKCVKDKKGEACMLEGWIALLGPDGTVTASYLMHGASIKDLSLKGHAGDTAGRPGKVTIKYESLEPPPPVVVASAPASITTTTSAATLDTPAKKHKGGFGHFVVGLVKDHGLQVVEVATGMTMASMLVKNFSLAKGANGQLSSGSQGQIASLAKMINSGAAGRAYNIGAPPAGLGFANNAAGQQSYLAMVRQQLVAKGADTSKFSLTTGAAAATQTVAAATTVPAKSPAVAAASASKAH